LLYGNNCVNSNVVTIPHPRMHERRFVLIPAAEIAGDAVHPGKKKTINKLLDECPDKSKVQRVTI
jgi:7,8-dihydro-6-hydroxymethylpterin-pyrophosphokinase